MMIAPGMTAVADLLEIVPQIGSGFFQRVRRAHEEPSHALFGLDLHLQFRLEHITTLRWLVRIVFGLVRILTVEGL
jgi:hypothetical protein